MKLELEAKTKTIIDGYHANSQTQQAAIEAVYEPFKTPSYAARFTDDGIREEIKEQVDEINKGWKQYDQTLNQTMKATVDKARADLMNAMGIREADKPDDYSVKIANARAFLKDELDSVDFANGVPTPSQAAEMDDTMHLILKDFIDDYDTMKLFKKMVERKTPVNGAFNGETLFPKTFGKMGKAESILNTLSELDEATENIFLHKRSGGREAFRYHNMPFFVPDDGYSEMAEEQAIADLSVILDDLADNIDSEGVA